MKKVETRNKLPEFGEGRETGKVKKKVTENKEDTEYPGLYFFQYKLVIF